jgi:hypothetical protein
MLLLLLLLLVVGVVVPPGCSASAGSRSVPWLQQRLLSQQTAHVWHTRGAAGAAEAWSQERIHHCAPQHRCGPLRGMLSSGGMSSFLEGGMSSLGGHVIVVITRVSSGLFVQKTEGHPVVG